MINVFTEAIFHDVSSNNATKFISYFDGGCKLNVLYGYGHSTNLNCNYFILQLRTCSVWLFEKERTFTEEKSVFEIFNCCEVSVFFNKMLIYDIAISPK